MPRKVKSNASVYAGLLSIADSLLHPRQQAGADQIAALADITHRREADMDDLPNLRVYATAAAEQMQTLSDYVRDSSLTDIIEDGTSLSKRYPWATATFAVAAGFALTRLVQQRSDTRQDVTQKPAKRRQKTSAGRVQRKSKPQPKANGQRLSTETTDAT